ncbi:hypothetical protein CTI12_AA299810 [Artemisia annua]|uniref:Rapid ALkalinization Factor n=1 Tax=Artemisia annua TaxID=35608 RepID=A0A2U1M8W1_ARTAN|nr:hypothetical protein CTI12_AA299810 [Artemisia annua]
MGQKMGMVVLILICGVLLESSDEAQPPHFQSVHGNPTRSPPKYADSPQPTTTHTHGGFISYRDLIRGNKPACNAGINGACSGAKIIYVSSRNCTLYSHCRGG